MKRLPRDESPQYGNATHMKLWNGKSLKHEQEKCSSEEEKKSAHTSSKVLRQQGNERREDSVVRSIIVGAEAMRFEGKW